MTRRSAALLALAAVCGLGCLASSTDDPKTPPRGKGVDTTSTPVDSADVPQSYLVLQESDLLSAGWPQDYTKYSLFMCNPALTAEDVGKIHHDVPGARVLSWTNVQDIPIGMYGGNPYFDSLTAAFDSTLCLRDLRTGNVVRVGGNHYEALPQYIISRTSADVLVAFVRDRMAGMGWDGIFVDQCTAEYPWWRKAHIDSVAPQFDIDGDGVADSMDELDTQYAAGRPYFTQRLREELGDGMVIMGNAGGPLADPSLNGIALEGVGIRFAVTDARGYLMGQLAVSRMPFVSSLLITDEGTQDPSLQLAREFAGVCYGTCDWFP